MSPEAIRAELDRIFTGPAFVSSQRSRDFLRYVVEESIAGRAEQIKERSIAMAVFGRAPDYAPGEDSIVRAKAVEVRKRLAQHYSSCGGGPLQIELPQGGYVPRFEGPAALPPRARPRWIFLAAGAVACVIALAVWMLARRTGDELDALWRPLATSPTAVVIGLPSPVVYDISGPVTSSVQPENIRALINTYVGTGAAYGAAQAAAMLTARGGHFVIKVGEAVSYEDLKTHPAVFLGSHTSVWTMDLGQKLRFRHRIDPLKGGVIDDTLQPGQSWGRRAGWETAAMGETYATVARFFEQSTGNPVLLLAGCGVEGTYAAGEFVSTASAFRQFTSAAPKDWPRRNFEIVVHAKVHGGVPGRPSMVAWHVW